jgi:hypothetical protein
VRRRADDWQTARAVEKHLSFLVCVRVPLPPRAEVRGYERQARELLLSGNDDDGGDGTNDESGDHHLHHHHHNRSKRSNREALAKVFAEAVARRPAVARSLLRLQTRMREALRRRLYLRHIEFDAW